MFVLIFHLGERVYNAEHALSDSFMQMGHHHRRITATFMKMQEDLTVEMYDWLECDKIQADTEVILNKIWNFQKLKSLLGALFTCVVGQFLTC